MDFDFRAFSTRSFERFAQAMALHVLGNGVLVFGDGPDGAREATYEGALNYPSEAEKWSGYTVMQAKFLQVPGTPQEDADWLVGQLRAEFNKFIPAQSNLRKPEFYILVSNARLSPMPASERGKGGIAKIDEVFSEYKDKIGIKDYRVWHLDQLATMLINAPEIRRSYSAWLSTSDVISEILDGMQVKSTALKSAMYRYISRELRSHQPIRLQQAGHSGDGQIMIEDVFTDLPYRLADQQDDEEQSGMLLLESILERSRDCLDGASVRAQSSRNEGRPERVLLLGGPGQGKSTVSQFLAQIFRANILYSEQKGQYSAEIGSIIESTLSKAKIAVRGINVPKRFPLRVDLPNFADWLSGEKSAASLLNYLARHITTIANFEVKIDDLRQWISSHPSILILDGLDEVPQSANRSAVLRAINELWDEAANADLLMIVTTRPQGYNDDLDPSYYSKLEMTPLSSEQALTYAIKLAAARIADPIHSERVVERIKEAAKSKTTARLMVSPLQVAILLALIDQRGDAPTDRWSLFDKYFAVVLQREQGKTGPIGQTMRHWGRQISAIHYKAGFLLHVEAETQGNSEAYLSKIDLERLIRSQLLDEEFEGEELQRATTELLSASTERLVLLVQRAEDRFSFEVRSLQEFMAAAHLMTGREAVVQERLRTISNRTHWLHVFQIAASKCFSENDSEQYRDTIITLCREINESGDEVDRLLRTGSKLALALLDDGLAYDQPKYRRLLLSTAFDLLLAGPATLPDSLSNHCERDPDRTIENIRRYLSSTLREPSSAAWKLILICSSRNQLWVKNILTEIWPADSDQAARLFEHWIDSSTNPELHTRMRHVLECASPLHIKQALNSEAGIDLRRRTDTLTKNYPSLALLIYSDDEIFTIAVNIGDRKTPLSLRTSSIKITPQRSRAYGDLPKTPCWEPQRALRDFHENPNTSTLATLLNRIAHEDWLEIFEEMLSNLPWPLATLIKSGRNKNSLIQIAEEVSKGSYGDNLDWHAAEERWKSQGVCEADLDFVASGLFFDSNVKSIGAPWSTLSLIHREEDSSWVDQILTCALSSQDKPRWWLRRILQFVLPVYMLPREISLEEALLLVEEPQDLDQPEWIDPSFLAILPQALLNEHPLLLRLGKFGESGRVNIARNIAVPAEVYSSLATRINEIPGLIVVLINTFLGDRLGPSLDALGEIDTATIRKNPSPAISGYSKILSNFTESIDEMSIEEVLRLPYHNEISLPSYTLKRILEDERVSREQGEKISEIIARIFNRNPTLRHINFMHIIRTFADSRQAELHRPSSWNSLQLGKSLFELTKHHERPEGIN